MPTQSTLQGHSIIAGEPVIGDASTINAFDPASNQPLDPSYTTITDEQLATAASAAEDALASLRDLSPTGHAAFLKQIASNIENNSEAIITRAMTESGLPRPRLTGELGRTVTQLQLFASVVESGDHRGVRIDPALPERKPLPRPDIRQLKVPVGPVAVFGASNFPLAFSTAGGDTASALAAGCPVVFKAHNAHPGTSELVGQAITSAVTECGLHPGTFSLVYGEGNAIGQALVANPAIKAVGFTGSRAGGQALVTAAAARPEPIPVYAEMSSINPVFVFPGALVGDIDDLAQAYVTSMTGSSGQLCTAPGLAFVPTGDAGDAFVDAIQSVVSDAAGQTMLTSGIAQSWHQGSERLADQTGVTLLSRGADGLSENAPAPAAFSTSVDSFLGNSVLQEEIFGAASLVIRYSSTDELTSAAAGLEGQLTATLQLTQSDHELVAHLLPILERKVGRILVNGWPTGVDVGHAMVHGGPSPATSDSRTTSVGSLAIDRFLRPVAYQSFPADLLPTALRDDNPWALNRLIDGTVSMLTREHDPHLVR